MKIYNLQRDSIDGRDYVYQYGKSLSKGRGEGGKGMGAGGKRDIGSRGIGFLRSLLCLPCRS